MFNGLTLVVVIALAIGVVIAYRLGLARARNGMREFETTRELKPIPSPAPPQPKAETPAVAPPAPSPAGDSFTIAEEKARLIVSYEGEAAMLRGEIRTLDAERTQLVAFAEDRRKLERDLAAARGETARYRQLVIDIENNAPPPLLDVPGTPDDLKLIVGVGPVLERMLYHMGVSTFRQIARWTERDIDDFEARLTEFPGRIRRDQWVTQARALHSSKYGEALPSRSGGPT